MPFDQYEAAETKRQLAHDEAIANIISSSHVEAVSEANVEDGFHIPPYDVDLEQDQVFPDTNGEEADADMPTQGRKRAISGSLDEAGDDNIEDGDVPLDVKQTMAFQAQMLEYRKNAKSPRGSGIGTHTLGEHE